jgi:hypothetical protein
LQAKVYHFTDTARLPWIIQTGELRPDRHRLGGFPADFVWATLNAGGDRTSAAQSGEAKNLYREGTMQLIRITLPGESFVGWREAVAGSVDWTAEHVSMLERAAQTMGEKGIENWRVHLGPLPFSAALAVDAKSYVGGRWVSITAHQDFCVTFRDEPQRRGFVIDNTCYFATRSTTPDGRTRYGQIGHMEASDQTAIVDRRQR